MAHTIQTYIPAAGHHAVLPLYDPLVWLLGADAARQALLDDAGIASARRVLDIGCGTGTLAVSIARTHPRVEVVGLDPDSRALARAARKAGRAVVSVRFDQGFSGALPYPDATFDRVLSSFMFHHLPADEKARTLVEVRRVLAPGGSFHMLDFAPPPPGEGGLLTRWVHASRLLQDGTEDRVLAAMRAAGLADSAVVRLGRLAFWRTACYRGSA